MINLTITNATITAGSTTLLAHASLHVAAGLDPLRLPARRLRELRKRCAYVDQDPGAALPPRYSVRSIMRSRAPLSDAQMLSLLADFGLDGVAGILDRCPQELSGGQRWQNVGDSVRVGITST